MTCYIIAGMSLALSLSVTLGGQSSSQPTTSPANADNTVPKYGDPDRRTIWASAQPDERDELRVHSRDASARGWDLIRRGDLDTAMRRFNQAWLLCPENPQALWGMAIVEFDRVKRSGGPDPEPADLRRLDGAVILMEEAVSLPDPEASLLTDSALVTATRGGMRKALGVEGAEGDFEQAEALLQRAQGIETHPNIYSTWAALEHYRGRPEVAAEYERKARELAQQRATSRRSQPGS